MKAAFAEAGIALVTVNPRPARRFAEVTGTRARTERADAMVPARMGPALDLPPRPVNGELMNEVKGMHVARLALIRDRTAARTSADTAALGRHALLRSMLRATTRCCGAYASWPKGGVENANGGLRTWPPRKTDLDETTDDDIRQIAMTLNLTPRKCLGFRSPVEAFVAELGKQVRIRFDGRPGLRA